MDCPSVLRVEDRHSQNVRPVEAGFKSILGDRRKLLRWDQLECYFCLKRLWIEGHATSVPN